jgi:hypothetical protein
MKKFLNHCYIKKNIYPDCSKKPIGKEEITMVKTFFDWVKEKGFQLPENTHRAGISHNYPPAYARGQYVDGYFMPTTSTAAGKLKGKIGS